MHFKDGTSLDKVTVEYPIGHRKRRDEGIKKLINKFDSSLPLVFSDKEIQKINSLNLQENFHDASKMNISEFIDYFVKKGH